MKKNEINPYGERKCDFMDKYKDIGKVAEICWFFGVRPEQLREELKRLLDGNFGKPNTNNKEYIVRWTNGSWQFLPDMMKELVRCKDCKHRYTAECIAEIAGFVNTPDDWYCGDGAKKE